MTDRNDYIQEDTRMINLYSQSATTLNNGSLKSDVLFNFKNILTEEANIIYTTIGVVTAQIPVSYYTINEYNQELVTDLGTITITSGNYNASSLITELTAQFTALSAVMVITINKITGKLTFTRTGTTTFSFSGSTAFDVLGFDTATNYTSVANVINAPFPLNLLGIQQLRINSSAFASYNSNSTTLGESNLVGVVQSTAPPFGMILYNNQNSYSILKNKRISQIDIQILDENGNLVDFNNIDWTLTFQMTIFRRVPLPNNSQGYLRPILQSLTTIQTALANQEIKPDDQKDSDASPPDPNDLVEQQLLNDDANSLDIMAYNKQLPS